MRSLLAHQRRLRCAVRPRAPPPPLSPDALGQRRQLAARLLTQFRERAANSWKAARAPAASPLSARARISSCAAAPRTAQRKPRGPTRSRRTRAPQRCLLTRRDQPAAARARYRPAPVQPILERGAPATVKPSRKSPRTSRAHRQGYRSSSASNRSDRPRARRRAARSSHHRTRGRDSRGAPQPPDASFSEWRACVAGLRPEHPHADGPGSVCDRRKGEVDEQREVLARSTSAVPGRRRGTRRHPEALELEGGRSTLGRN